MTEGIHPADLPAVGDPLADDVVVSVRDVWKKFCRNLRRSMYYGILDLGRNLVGVRPDSSGLRRHEFWALQGLDLQVHRGESVGLIGFNGAGKSTLLRVLTGIFPPDRGEVAIRGTIGGLIALGAGMHPHLTGRENIYLKGAILGMSREEIAERLESIIRFSEIEDSIDAPISTYSSGMHVRLGFSIAIHCQPDILVIDEVLAVGDLSFVNKSLRRLHEYKEQANAIIYISHNLEQVRNLCERIVVLDKGGIVFDGEANEAVRVYQDMAAALRVERERRPFIKAAIPGKSDNVVQVDEAVEFLDFGLRNPAGEETEAVGMSEPLEIYFRFRIRGGARKLFFGVSVIDESKNNVLWVMSNDFHKEDFDPFTPGDYEMVVRIEEHHLMSGVYYPLITLRDDVTMETYTRFTPGHCFRVTSEERVFARGLVHVQETWNWRRTGDAPPSGAPGGGDEPGPGPGDRPRST